MEDDPAPTAYGWIRWARDQARDLPPTEAHVLLVIATYAGPDGIARASLADIGAGVSRGRAVVSAALGSLRDRGLLTTKARGPKAAEIRLGSYAQPGPSYAQFPVLRSDPPDLSFDEARALPVRPAGRVDAGSLVRGSGVNPSVNSPDGSGGRRADCGTSSTPSRDLAAAVAAYLQRGIDGLTSEEPARRVTAKAVGKALTDHPVTDEVAWDVATSVRSIAQSQNRAPNLAGLYARRIARAAGEGAPAATGGRRRGLDERTPAGGHSPAVPNDPQEVA